MNVPQSRNERRLRERMKPKKRHLMRLDDLGLSSSSDSNDPDDRILEFSFMFKDKPDNFGMRSVAVFIGDPEDDYRPVMVVPVTGELDEERKRHIVKKLMEMLHACMGEGRDIGDVVRVGGDSR